MGFSTDLVDRYRAFSGATSDSAAAKAIPKLTKQNLHEIRNGKRFLTAEQVVFLAKTCEIDEGAALAELLAETTELAEVKSVWLSVSQRLKRTAS